MASIADVFLRALLEDKQLQIDAQKSGDQAGETMGSRMSKGIGTAMRAGLGVIAAIATKGLVELENVTADFTAATGASAEEAERAGKAINEMAGRNLQPMAEVGEALTKVHTDLGLTGEAAEDTTERFLKFATATKQDAAGAVLAFDDILDAWGKEASDAGEIMDKLIVSHQEYGGTIEGNEAALAAMAPQLKAFNLGIDDGIALLNLFNASGLDAASIPKALNAAIQKLDGRPLEDFVAELAGIEDPAERAERAIEIFGSKAGVSLANAIKPGMTSLDDFQISADEAAGATVRASDAIEGTFSNRVQLAIKGVTEKIIEFGSSFGPALTGIASIASLGGALGLDRLVGPIVKALAEAGKAGGEAFIDASSTAIGALGTVIGNLVANVLDPSHPLLGKPLAKVGAAAGAVWGRVFAAGTKVAELLSAVLLKLPGVGIVRSAVLSSAITLGTLQGSTMGKAAGLAFRGGFVLGLASIADDINNAIQDATKDVDVLGAIGIETDFNPEAVGWPLGPAESEWSRWFFGSLPEGIRQGAKDAFGIIPAEAGAAADEAWQVAHRAGERIPLTLAESAEAGAPAVEEGTEIMLDGMAGALLQAAKDARQAGRDAVGAYASALRGGWDSVFGAWTSLKDAMKDPMSRAKRIARLEGLLASKRLAEGLRSNDPLIRADAEALVIAAEDELALLREGAEDRGKKGGKGFADGLFKTRDDAKAAARLVANAAAGALAGLNLRDEGAAAGGEFAKGLQSTINNVARVASALAAVVAQYLEFGSPTELGPFSKKGGPAGWARIGATDWVKGWQSIDPRPAVGGLAASAAAALSAPLTASFAAVGGAALSAPSLPNVAGAAVRTGDTFNLYLPDAQHRDPWTVLDRLPRYAKQAKAAASETGWRTS